MRGRLAKALRRLAREELAGAPAREELVAHPRTDTTGINSPDTQRAMQREIKKAWKRRNQ